MFGQIIKILSSNIDKHGFLVGGIIDLVICSFIGCLIYAILHIIFSLLYNPEKTSQRNGEKYENKIDRLIQKYFGIAVLRNLIFYKENGDSTEADMVFVTNKGVFCIECKSREYPAIKMSGGMSSSEWVVELRNGRDSMYNPIKQNSGHINALISQVPEVDNAFNIVITNIPFGINSFGNVYESKKCKDFCNMLDSANKSAILSTSGGARGIRAFKKALKRLPKVYTNDQVKSIYEDIKSHVGTKEQRKLHVEQQKEYQNS